MRSWISRSDRSVRLRVLVGAVVGSILWLTGAGGDAAASSFTWDGSLAVTGGGESDVVLDPTRDPILVPGGAFLELAPEFRLRGRLSNRLRLHVRGRGEWDHYANEADRDLLGGLAEATLQWWRPRWEARLTLGGSGFDDSERPTVRRVAGGAEIGLARRLGRWRLEAQGGLQTRRYPELLVLDEVKSPTTYTEQTAEAALAASFVAGPTVLVGGRVGYLATDARDDLYDSHALTGQAFVSWRVATRTRIFGSGLLQRRDLYERAPGYDEDSTWQVGFGVDQALTPRLEVQARWAFSRYALPEDENQDVQRGSVGLVWRFGGPSQMSALEDVLRLVPGGEVGAPAPVAGRPITLRLRAPDAAAVSVVGDFNGWQPEADPLHRTADGWWATQLVLPAGTYEYAFLVDGRSKTPPEATVTVGDGFGGRNGVLRVRTASETGP